MSGDMNAGMHAPVLLLIQFNPKKSVDCGLM